jgi:hypothetical protein
MGDFVWATLYGRLCMGDFCSGHVPTHENVNSFVIVVRVNGENENGYKFNLRELYGGLSKRCVAIDYQSGRLLVGDFLWATFYGRLSMSDFLW